MADHPILAEDMQEIVESFLVESDEILEALDHDLLQLEQTPDDRALVDRVFRGVHTVKGTASFLSLEQLSVLTHHFEDVLNKLRQNELDFDPAMMDVLFDAFDHMKLLQQQVVDRRIEPLDLDALLARVKSVAAGTYTGEEAPSLPAPAKEVKQAPEPEEEEQENAPEPPAAEKGAAETQDAAEGKAPAASAASTSSTAGSASAPSPKRRATDTIRVNTQRLDRLMDLVGELVLGRNRLLQLVEDARTTQSAPDEKSQHALLSELLDTTAQVDLITSELQGAVMRTRMVQVGRVFNKFPRVVRDLAREFDKQIDLVIEGEETELDKSLVEQLSDPLVHLVRNAADHGIEQPAVRRDAGKDPAGRLRLAAKQESNHIVIEIADDGAGLDAERIKQKAIEKKLISSVESDTMSDADAHALIFEPGFSTMQQVSHVSGRGVGMDVVKTTLTQLSGSISIDSSPGEGTCFSLRLPLTLAIIQSMLVHVGEEIFALPLHSVLEVVHLGPGDAETINGQEVMYHRDRVLPIIRMGDTLDARGYRPEARQHAYAVIVSLAHQRLAIVVDDLISQKEIVIKGLGDYLDNVPGITGSTILGDGRVIMIVDVGELIRLEKDRRRTLRRVAA